MKVYRLTIRPRHDHDEAMHMFFDPADVEGDPKSLEEFHDLCVVDVIQKEPALSLVAFAHCWAHDVEASSFEQAVVKATGEARGRAAREVDMAITYFWFVDTLRSLKPAGVLATKDPTPLTVEEAELTLRSLRHASTYSRQTVLVLVDGGQRIVKLQGGAITTDELEGP